MVIIRLSRRGSTHSPKYRITVADQRRSATGRFIEVVGHYNPLASGNDPKLHVDKERVDYWISQGAQMTKRVKSLVQKA